MDEGKARFFEDRIKALYIKTRALQDRKKKYRCGREYYDLEEESEKIMIASFDAAINKERFDELPGMLKKINDVYEKAEKLF